MTLSNREEAIADQLVRMYEMTRGDARDLIISNVQFVDSAISSFWGDRKIAHELAKRIDRCGGEGLF